MSWRATAHQLNTLTVFPEDPGLNPRTYITHLITGYSSSSHTHGTDKLMQVHTHIHTYKNKYIQNRP